MNVVLLPFVVEGGEILLPDQPRQAVGGGHVAGGERGQGRRVQRFGFPHAGNLLAVAVHQTDHPGVGVVAELLDEIPDDAEIFLEQDDVGGGQSRLQKNAVLNIAISWHFARVFPTQRIGV